SDADGWICKPLTREKLLGAVTRFVLKKEEPQSAAPVTEVPKGAGKRVLLVEDDAVIAARIEFALEKDCAVVTVDEGEAAIRQLLSENYDCVLLDLTLARLRDRKST